MDAAIVKHNEQDTAALLYYEKNKYKINIYYFSQEMHFAALWFRVLNMQCSPPLGREV